MNERKKVSTYEFKTLLFLTLSLLESTLDSTVMCGSDFLSLRDHEKVLADPKADAWLVLQYFSEH